MSFSIRRGSHAHRALIFPLSLLLLCVALGAHASPPLRSAYVVGSNDASLTRVDLDSGEVVPNVATVGSAPNRVDVDPVQGILVTANSGSDDVTVFDLTTESVLGALALPAGSNPWAARIVDGRVFVSALLQDAVHVLDLSTGTLLTTIPVGKAPEGMCVAAGKLFVANSGFDFATFEYDAGTVTVIDLAALAVVTTIPVNLNPQECLALPDGTVHVVCTGDFFLTEGAIDVLDPSAGTLTASFTVAGYPGGGDVHPANAVFLNVTSTSFGSEVQAYEAASYGWIFDDSNALLPSFDFYGNLRATSGAEILVPDFTQDLLLLEDPATPGATVAYLVGDGPIDVAFVEREGPLPLLLSGLVAQSGPDGVRLSWRASLEADVHGFVVERREAGGPWSRIAELPAAREMSWLDDGVTAGHSYSWRVGAIGYAGDVTWAAPLALSLRVTGGERLAFRGASPNPSHADVVLGLTVPHAGELTLEILDVAGRRVTTIPLGRRSPGVHEVRWDGHDATGRAAAPGMYFARVSAGGETAVERILRVR